MTTNIDRAAEIIHDHHDNCLDAANALADAGLLAAECKCPALDNAPAAVAEVVRLRQALEGRLRVWEKVADRLAAQGDDGAELMRLVLKQVTHILEGEV